ncbi:MAG: BlaI/MecI/CopY family transcriptional regulator [Eubacteriaceae bacterium]|nr:BlaI/MecI/CopY family transcriptional regulator [Eubacteriaceae bacterium]
MKLTDAEWAVMEVLWEGEKFSLKEVTDKLFSIKGWNKNTVHTYLTRMEKKGYVSIEKHAQKPYSANIIRDDCAKEERNDLLSRVYKGSAGDLIAAFLKESKISKDEVDNLRKMLDDMEV